jgi:AraC-like DNA-binding protein
MHIDAKTAKILLSLERNGVHVEKEITGRLIAGVDMVFPHIMVLLCLRGTARVMFDMQELTIEKNDLGVLMPNHFLRRISCSEDYAFACVFISVEMLNELKKHAFSHDSDKYNYDPVCRLTDVQAKRVIALIELLEAIASHTLYDLKLRQQMLLSHMAVGYEFINYYRQEQDKQWIKKNVAAVYPKFCDLVVKHHKENRNVNFYARLLDYDPRYFSKIIRQYSNGLTPLKWIQQYIAAQAMFIMDQNPKQSIKNTGLQLGFPTVGNFCRYFKSATGMYPLEYKKMSQQRAENNME